MTNAGSASRSEWAYMMTMTMFINGGDGVDSVAHSAHFTYITHHLPTPK
jgi:hypothetical protein